MANTRLDKSQESHWPWSCVGGTWKGLLFAAILSAAVGSVFFWLFTQVARP